MKNLHVRLNCSGLGMGGCSEGAYVPIGSLCKLKKLRKALKIVGWRGILGEADGAALLIPVCACCALAFLSDKAGKSAEA
jgi:hypothetical protein